MTQDSLRAHIGMVSQDSSLLHRSVRDNIVYGRPDASEDEMRAAAERAEAIAASAQAVRHTLDVLRQHGLHAPLVTGAGTGSLVNEAASGLWGELQAGSYLFMDADYAAETANLSRAQILQQAGNAMVAQANQLPQQVLSLLQR